MARIFITGSTDGLGRAAASELIGKGHAVIFHARSAERAGVVADLAARSGGVVIGDLASATETRKIADRVNGSGAVDAIIHNAGIYDQPGRDATPEGHARTLAVNCLAPYMLTAWIKRPRRLIYLSSGLHRDARPSLDDMDWTKALEREQSLFRKQALSHGAGLRNCPPLGRCSEQCGGSGLGADKDGRRRSPG